MCLECGCGRLGRAKIDGKPADEVDSPVIGIWDGPRESVAICF